MVPLTVAPPAGELSDALGACVSSQMLSTTNRRTRRVNSGYGLRESTATTLSVWVPSESRVVSIVPEKPMLGQLGSVLPFGWTQLAEEGRWRSRLPGSTCWLSIQKLRAATLWPDPTAEPESAIVPETRANSAGPSNVIFGPLPSRLLACEGAGSP